MPVDYHIHTSMCGHATGEMDSYVEEAQKKGLTEIGFSDHIPMYFLPLGDRDASIAMREDELPIYVQKVRRIQTKYNPYPVRLGIEADFTPGLEKELSKILNQYEFDYVLGSIHFINGWGFDNPLLKDQYSKWDLHELYKTYFDLVGQAALSGLFDILSHPDLIKKFGYRPEGDIGPIYETVVRQIADAGVCFEINTAGLRVPAKELYPQVDFLKLCHAAGVSVSLGSDAHAPKQVGMDFDKALSLLRETGYREVVTFSGRRKNYRKI